MSIPSDPDRRLLVSVDMERYSRQDNELQFRSQQIFQQAMADAVLDLGLDRTGWMTQHGGDGELAVLPPGTPEPKVVGELVFAVDKRLAAANLDRADGARVRLRMAMHEGLVHLDGAAGFPGAAVVTVSRLVDAPPVKAALRAYRSANVVLIVSNPIYQDVVLAYRRPRPDRFLKVEASIAEKGFAQQAWIFIPDEDVTRGGGISDEEETGPRAGGRRSATGESATTSYNIGEVSGESLIFGNHGTINRR